MFASPDFLRFSRSFCSLQPHRLHVGSTSFFSQPDIHVTGNLFPHSSQYIKKPNYVITSCEVGPKLIQKRKLPGSIFTNKLAVKPNQVKSAHLSTAEMYIYTIIVQVAAHYRWGTKWVFNVIIIFAFISVCTYVDLFV